MLSESGIDLGFDVFAEIEQDHRCYEVKARSLTQSSTNPSLLMDPDMIKVKPDPDGIPPTMSCNTNIGPASLTRTNFKLQLQREHLLEMEKKEQQRLRLLAAQLTKQHIVQQQQKLIFPNVPASTPFSVPRTAFPMKSISSNLPANLPSSVLKVETKLQNPTQYYIKQQQKRQVREYLTNQQQQKNTVSMMPVSAPCALQNFNFTTDLSSPSFLNPSSNVTSPNSPDTTSSVASGSEVDSVLDDLFGLDSVNDQDFSMLSDSIFSATLPTTNNLLDTYGFNSMQKIENNDISSSCPVNVKQEVPDNYVKERQKKDNHNMIERRRRYNINDRIKELGTLVPKLDKYVDFKQNKGTILKSSVDYIKRLKRDRDRLKQYESRSHNLEDRNKKLMLRVQELELILRASNISTTLPEPDLSSATSPQLTQLLVGNQMNFNQQQRSMLGHSTLHNLLKLPPGTSSETVATVMSSSVDSPRMDLRTSSLDDDDIIIMEADP